MGNIYHSDCLNCQKCNAKLWFKSFYKKGDGKLYCNYDCKEAINLPPINNAGDDNIEPALSNSEISRRRDHTKQKKFLEIFAYNSDYAFPNISKNKIYDVTSVSNGFEVKKPPRPKVGPEPFFYNRPDTIISDLKPKANIEYNLNSPFASVSMSEFDKNVFLSKRQLLVFKPRTQRSQKIEPFSYNKLEKIDNDSNIKLKQFPNPPFALHSNYMQVVQNKMIKSEEIDNQCNRCNLIIKDKKEIFEFRAKKYHKSCLRCSKCNHELFFMKKILNDPNSDEKLYCEHCYTDIFSPKCAKCNQLVASYMLSTQHEDKIYHKECFFCQRCRKYVSNEQYFKAGKIILCRNCL